MDNLIKIEKQLIGTEFIEAVNARELHEKLQVITPFSMWIQRRLEETMAFENIDFTSFNNSVKAENTWINTKEYVITLDLAKHMAMLERSEIGKQIRQYFIDFEKQAKPAIQTMLTNPKLMIELLQNYQKEIEAKELALKRAEEAERTKAWIGSKREATAMSTASEAVRKANKLAEEKEKLTIELGKSKKYASTISVSKLTGYSTDAYMWYPLKKYCIENGLEIKKEFNAAYGKINTYPAEAWLRIYNIDIDSLINQD